MATTVYTILEEDSNMGTSVEGTYYNYDDAKAKLAELRKTTLENNKEQWLKENVDINKELTEEDFKFDLQDFQDVRGGFVWYDWYGNYYELSINENNLF